MTSENTERNARASMALGFIGLVAFIWIAFGVALTVLGSDEPISALREESSLILLLVICAFSTVRNFQIAASLRKQQ